MKVENILTNDNQVRVETTHGTLMFDKEDDNTLIYNLQESTAAHFPTSEIMDQVEEQVEREIEDIFPVEFTMVASDDQNTRSLLKSADLPVEETGLVDLFWCYPGEVFIEAELRRRQGKLTIEPTAIEYEGTRFTPEE